MSDVVLTIDHPGDGPMSQATVAGGELPNGYWWARVDVRVPSTGVSQRFEGDAFHGREEARVWVASTIAAAIRAWELREGSAG